METCTSVLAVAATLAILSSLSSPLAAVDAVNGEADFISGLASVVDGKLSTTDIEWNYSDGPNGPSHWGDLSEDWKECKEGTTQSPVAVTEEDIVLDRYVDAPAHVYYKPASAFITGDGKTLEVHWNGGILNLQKYDFALQKLIFHAPSEHTYFGERFPVEVQLYHYHPDGGTAISSLMFVEGAANEWLEQITGHLPGSTLGTTIKLGLLDASGIKLDDLDWNRYYRYQGSITVPPCTQNRQVTWSLLKLPVTASSEQIGKIRAALNNTPNARPVQPKFGRTFHYPRFVDS